MSPACVATVFEGDNGGPTARGVSATEIRVAVPIYFGYAQYVAGRGDAWRDSISALFDFFNSHFEFYGRRMVPVFVDGRANDPVTSRALGVQTAAQEPFAAITGPLEASENYTLSPGAVVQELARAGVVTVTENRAAWWSDRLVFDPYHPYLWSIHPSSEKMQAALGSVTCSLVGQPATNTTDPDIVGKARRFAIFAAGSQVAPKARPLVDAIQGCGGQVDAVEWTQIADPSSTSMKTAFARFAADGVTTVICVCENVLVDSVTATGAHSQGFHPEWITTPTAYAIGDELLFTIERLNSVLDPPIQLQPGPRVQPLPAEPWFSAILEMAPQLLQDGVRIRSTYEMMQFTYAQLLVIATGIQAAGPELTAAAFGQGLMSVEFPNPGMGTSPDWRPAVGFGPGDHAFYDDFAVAWWSDAAPSVAPLGAIFGGRGSWCYVGVGERFRAGEPLAGLQSRLFDTSIPCR